MFDLLQYIFFFSHLLNLLSGRSRIPQCGSVTFPINSEDTRGNNPGAGTHFPLCFSVLLLFHLVSQRADARWF